MINIIGQVSSPGFYIFRPGNRILDAIGEAGGFAPNADKKDIFITYPNGISKQYKRWFGNHKILDGSTISIGEIEPKDPVNSTELASDIASILQI